MSQKKASKGHSRSWRTLKQNGKNRAVTPEAKKKRMRMRLRTFFGACTLVTVAAFITACAYLMQTQPGMLRLSGPSPTLRTIHFDTDGVLTHTWLRKALSIPRGTPMMGVDIYALDEKLEAYGQVKEVSISRAFPDAIIVDVEEHNPILRVRAKNANGDLEDLLVSSKGDVYEGHDYPELTLKALPYLAGVSLKKDDDGNYKPLKGMDHVAELLNHTREELPGLYRRWAVVDCRDFDGRTNVEWAVIRIRTAGLGEWRFRPRQFNQQLSELKRVLATMDNRDYENIERIDLSLQGQPAVRVANASFRSSR